MLNEAALDGSDDRELQALKHELDADLHDVLVSLDSEFHDREDLVYERQCRQLRSLCFCSECLNVPPRGGEFLHE